LYCVGLGYSVAAQMRQNIRDGPIGVGDGTVPSRADDEHEYRPRSLRSVRTTVGITAEWTADQMDRGPRQRFTDPTNPLVVQLLGNSIIETKIYRGSVSTCCGQATQAIHSIL